MRLLRVPRFLLLLIGQAVNGIGSWAALIAIWGFAAYRFHSGPAEVAVLTLCWSAPAAVFGPVLGIPIDRVGPRRVLLIAYGGSALSALLMATASSLSMLAVFTLIYGTWKAFSIPAADALPPRIVDKGDLLAANALLGAAQESAIVFGPLVSAAAIAVAGFRAAFVVDAVTYLVGIAVVLPLRLSPVDPRPRVRLRHELAEGVVVAARRPLLRYVLVLSMPVFLTWGAFVVIEPLYARDVLHRPASQFAMFQVAFGIGLVLTGFLIPKLGERVAGPRALAVSVMLSGLAAALYVGTHSVLVAYLGVFAWGVDVAFFDAPARTLLQRGAPVEAHGRIMALHRTLHSIGDLVAVPLTGVAIGAVGVQPTALVVGGLVIVCGCIGLVAAPRAVDEEPVVSVGAPATAAA